MLSHQLNEDVLQFVISELAGDGRTGNIDLVSLALTWRSISRLARHAVSQYISLDSPSHKFYLFKRSLNENPAYGYGVVSFHRSQPSRRYSPMDQRQLNSFLHKLPNIRTIALEAWCGEPPFLPSLSRLPFWDTIREFIHEDLPTAEDLLGLMSLPRLHHFKENSIEGFEFSSNNFIPKFSFSAE